MLRRRRQEPLETPPDEFDDEDERPSDPDWMIDTLSHGPEVIVEQAERSQLLWQLVDGLPQEKQEVLHLIYQKEMALREAAIELGIPEGTVKSHLRYAIIDTKRGTVIVLFAWKILTKDNVNRDGITRKVRYMLYFGDISNECEWDQSNNGWLHCKRKRCSLCL